MTSIRDWKKEANTQFHGTAKIKEYQSRLKKMRNGNNLNRTG